jgi:hypothetical protein
MIGFDAIQGSFACALREPDKAPPSSLRGGPGQAIKRRFNVYRNNVYAGLIGVLEARYPAVLRLVGDDFFRAMARIFVDRSPPRSAVLLDYGAGFPEFLRTFQPVADEPYLPDIALLEWSMHKGRHAADCATLRASDVAALGYGGSTARVELAPAIALVTSAYPVFSIWRANTSTELAVGPMAFSGAECVLVTRPALVPEAVRIPRSAAVFVTVLRDNGTLGDAAAAALALHSDFPLNRVLALLLGQKSIVSITPGDYTCEARQT